MLGSRSQPTSGRHFDRAIVKMATGEGWATRDGLASHTNIYLYIYSVLAHMDSVIPGRAGLISARTAIINPGRPGNEAVRYLFMYASTL